MLDALPPMLVSLVAAVAGKTPEDEDVVAGPIALLIFVLLIVAVALLGWSLTRQLRKAEAAKAAGVYGDEPAQQDDERDDQRDDRSPPA